MNRRAKYDAASVILGGEIRKRTNTPTATNISILSVCVDKKSRHGCKICFIM